MSFYNIHSECHTSNFPGFWNPFLAIGQWLGGAVLKFQVSPKVIPPLIQGGAGGI